MCVCGVGMGLFKADVCGWDNRESIRSAQGVSER